MLGVLSLIFVCVILALLILPGVKKMDAIMEEEQFEISSEDSLRAQKFMDLIMSKDKSVELTPMQKRISDFMDRVDEEVDDA